MKKPGKCVLREHEKNNKAMKLQMRAFNDCHDLLTAYQDDLLKEVLEVYEKYSDGGDSVEKWTNDMWSAIKNLAQRVKESHER